MRLIVLHIWGVRTRCQPNQHTTKSSGFFRFTVVFFNMLAQSTDSPFFCANCEFQFFVEMDVFVRLSSAEQFEQQSRHLREVAKNVLNLAPESVVFRAVWHTVCVAKQAQNGLRQSATVEGVASTAKFHGSHSDALRARFRILQMAIAASDEHKAHHQSQEQQAEIGEVRELREHCEYFPTPTAKLWLSYFRTTDASFVTGFLFHRGNARSHPHSMPRGGQECSDPNLDGFHWLPRADRVKDRRPMDVPRTNNCCRCYKSLVACLPIYVYAAYGLFPSNSDRATLAVRAAHAAIAIQLSIYDIDSSRSFPRTLDSSPRR